ncbi:MAG: septal ring lytic transglycosylase RlpA family protein [Solirubrobacterales bacterium]
MAVIAMLAAAASNADASSGGVADPTAESGSCDKARFGSRTLSLGDCGRGVKTLNWLLNSNRVARQAPLGRDFESRTEGAVSRFERKAGLRSDGVADRRTSKRLVRSMRKDIATWYGPGFYGNRTACGRRLKRGTVGVAHRSLPCGTKVTVRYEGRFLRTRVIDRGPFANDASWDLTEAAAKRVGFEATDQIRTAIVR